MARKRRKPAEAYLSEKAPEAEQSVKAPERPEAERKYEASVTFVDAETKEVHGVSSIVTITNPELVGMALVQFVIDQSARALSANLERGVKIGHISKFFMKPHIGKQ